MLWLVDRSPFQGARAPMTPSIDRRGQLRTARYAAGLGVLAGLYLTSLYSYDLFHSLVELFGVVVAAAVFVIAWNARRHFANEYVLSLGIALLFVAGVDVLHTLAYQGLSVFPGYTANLPTQLWIVARSLQTLAFLLAPLLLNRRLHPNWYLAGFGALSGILVILVFTRIFPDAFVPGSGLTTFKIVCEYVICAFLLGALGLLVWRRRAFETTVFRRMAAAILITIVSELFFTFYTSPFGPANMGGHLLKLVAFYLIYRAVVETALVRPYSLLFRELKQSEEGLRQREEEQRYIADVLQEALLTMPTRLAGIAFGHLYRPATSPARVGGDFFDLFALPGHRVGLLMGDVCGHGLEAAALMAVAKDTIEAFAFDDRSPAAALQKANLVVIHSTSKRQDQNGRFVTAFYGVLDKISGRVQFSSAGHPPGIIRRASGETYFLSGASPVLGVFADARYGESEDILSPGDLLLLYTDGLTDLRWDSQILGEERLLAFVASLGDVETSEFPKILYGRITELAGDQRSDDLAILAVSLETG